MISGTAFIPRRTLAASTQQSPSHVQCMSLSTHEMTVTHAHQHQYVGASSIQRMITRRERVNATFPPTYLKTIISPTLWRSSIPGTPSYNLCLVSGLNFGGRSVPFRLSIRLGNRGCREQNLRCMWQVNFWNDLLLMWLIKTRTSQMVCVHISYFVANTHQIRA